MYVFYVFLPSFLKQTQTVSGILLFCPLAIIIICFSFLSPMPLVWNGSLEMVTPFLTFSSSSLFALILIQKFARFVLSFSLQNKHWKQMEKRSWTKAYENMPPIFSQIRFVVVVLFFHFIPCPSSHKRFRDGTEPEEEMLDMDQLQVLSFASSCSSWTWDLLTCPVELLCSSKTWISSWLSIHVCVLSLWSLDWEMCWNISFFMWFLSFSLVDSVLPVFARCNDDSLVWVWNSFTQSLLLSLIHLLVNFLLVPC